MEEGDQSLRPLGCTPAFGRVAPIHRAKGRAMNGAPEDLVITAVAVGVAGWVVLAFAVSLMVPGNFGRMDEGHGYSAQSRSQQLIWLLQIACVGEWVLMYCSNEICRHLNGT
jgi:hypothetical protein